MPPPLNEIDQVAEIKLLEVIFHGNFNFELHVNYIMSLSSQRIYLIKLLSDQGLCGERLETVFQALIISRLTYDLSVWSSFIAIEQCGRINAFLKRSLKYGLTQKCFNMNEILSKADCTSFKAIQLSDNCLHSILPPSKRSLRNVRTREDNFEPPISKTITHKESFIPRCLFSTI